MPAHVWADITVGDLEGQQVARPIAAPVLLGDVALRELAVDVFHIVCCLDLVVFVVEGYHVLISEEQVHFLLIDCLHQEAVAEDFAEPVLTWLLVLFGLAPKAVFVLAGEMDGLTGGLTAAIGEEDRSKHVAVRHRQYRLDHDAEPEVFPRDFDPL